MRHGRIRIGIFEATHGAIGGDQLVAAHAAATLIQDYTVELIHGESYILKDLTKAFAVDLTGVKERIFPLKPGFNFGLPGIEHTTAEIFKEGYNLTIRMIYSYTRNGSSSHLLMRNTG